MLRAARIVGLAVRPAPGAHQVVEYVGEEIGPAAADVLLLKVLALAHELRAARPFSHELHPAGALQLQCDPDCLLDAASGRDDTVIAQQHRIVLPETARDRCATLGRRSEERRV